MLTASGGLVAISKLKPGDKVLATNTRTGKTQAEPVAAVLVHYDKDRYDLKVRAAGHTAVIKTTRSHLFWNQSSHHWVKAAALKYGTHLHTADGGISTVVGGWTPTVTTGWMWDLTIPGNNDHDFYIGAAAVTPSPHARSTAGAVLVHNCGDDDEVARMIHDAHPDSLIRERFITVGVITTDAGQFAAQAGDEFTEEQLEVMAAHNIQPRPFIGGGLHAEPQLLTFARDGDLLQQGEMSPESIGASRPFCGPEKADCANLIQNSGATIERSTQARW